MNESTSLRNYSCVATYIIYVCIMALAKVHIVRQTNVLKLNLDELTLDTNKKILYQNKKKKK